MNEILGLVTAEETRTGKSKPFLQIDVKSVDGNIKAVIWDIDDAMLPNLPKKGQFLSIVDYKDQRDTKYNNIIINNNGFSFKQKSDLPTDVLDKIFSIKRASIEDLKAAYLNITDKSLYKDEANYKFVMGCLASVSKDKLLSCPAAKSVHHGYSGGLIIHTSEVLSIAKGIVQAFPNPALISQDVVYCAATLHDLGKVFTYGLDDIGNPTSSTEEHTIGHIYYSVSVCDTIAKTKPVSQAFLSEVKHAIAAHHGSPQFGAIKTPATLEAIIVSQADFLGSRLGIIDTKLELVKSNKQNLDEEWKQYGDYYAVTSAVRSAFNAK